MHLPPYIALTYDDSWKRLKPDVQGFIAQVVNPDCDIYEHLGELAGCADDPRTPVKKKSAFHTLTDRQRQMLKLYDNSGLLAPIEEFEEMRDQGYVPVAGKGGSANMQLRNYLRANGSKILETESFYWVHYESGWMLLKAASRIALKAVGEVIHDNSRSSPE